MPIIRVQREAFDPGAEVNAFCARNAMSGGVATFIGQMRDFNGPDRAHGETITAMTLEHYPGMAEAEIGRHADEALARWPLTGLTIIHRFGRIAPGENIVLVVTASSHRQAAFEAAEFLMDFLKTRATFWKKEADAAGNGEWVDARESDDAALARWGSAPPVRL